MRRKYGPGIYEDRNGAIHLFIPEFLEGMNVADTPENRANAEKFVADYFSRHCPTTKLNTEE